MSSQAQTRPYRDVRDAHGADRAEARRAARPLPGRQRDSCSCPVRQPGIRPGQPPQRTEGLLAGGVRCLAARDVLRPARLPGRQFFRLARVLPGRVAVPPVRDIVIGGALTAAGHDWNSTSSSDIADAADSCCRSARTLVIEGGLDCGGRWVRRWAALFGTGMESNRHAGPQCGSSSRPTGPSAVRGTLLLHPRLRARSRVRPRMAQPHARARPSPPPRPRYTRRATPVGPAVSAAGAAGRKRRRLPPRCRRRRSRSRARRAPPRPRGPRPAVGGGRAPPTRP